MIFLAIPVLLETVLIVATSTIVAKTGFDIYDRVLTRKDDHSDPEQTTRN